MVEFQVENMTCGSCANVISKSIKTIDPNVQVSVDVVSQTVRVDSILPENKLASLIEECGYPVSTSTVVER
ncbi:copper chaperone [Leptospira yasudae]|uniref:Copper chaperone n=1 Tax=Leptospira yasudae TaxID=2202201 RepID=A0ABX9M2H6_9LEPT|nr:heavy-metal-associated domain-containing protein [Leptospira yasudae]MBW0432092.1 heavy-metal-associated domain-containing protein [Leptospira yasudae]RHX79699.1 copper chaperone [Leptospira yasudae]RHX95514.1 copper chaperone [Leptospira yasudae]TGK27048.1 copper chaperone [Leptospira yasudae]TGM08158.1 copper chaperone [Leptospira yasudae]